jgi:hypothetical protein
MIKRNDNIGIEQLKNILEYDQESGIFHWKKPHRKAGKIAGSFFNNGYRRIIINRISYTEHRLVWLYMTGEWPVSDIDHINLCRSDNRWANLRLASTSQNHANRRVLSNNKSGYKGVVKRRRKWAAFCRGEYIGMFSTPEQANIAYEKRAIEIYGDFARAS